MSDITTVPFDYIVKHKKTESIVSIDKHGDYVCDIETEYIPLVKGEWISVCGNKQCNCSVCGEGFDHTYEWIERWNFCPNCGARMKGADDGVDDV